jgi:predicted secreted protein
MRTARLLLAALALGLAGCHLNRRYFAVEPEKNQAVRVQSGDRLYFELEENATTGYSWTATCDDADVSVTIVHKAADARDGLVGAPGKAEVEIRVHRGYDGPSTVSFAYRRPWEKSPVKEFSVALYKRVDDTAFWE